MPPGVRFRSLIVPAILVLSAFIGCEEPLPPRILPAIPLVPGIRVSSGNVEIQPKLFANFGSIHLTAVSTHDEVLSGPARIQGLVTVKFKQYIQTVRFTSGDLVKPSMVVGSTVTIHPKDTIALLRSWDHFSDQDDAFWTLVQYHDRMTPDGEKYRVSDTAWMEIRATFQIFQRAQPMKLPVLRVPVVYTDFAELPSAAHAAGSR